MVSAMLPYLKMLAFQKLLQLSPPYLLLDHPGPSMPGHLGHLRGDAHLLLDLLLVLLLELLLVLVLLLLMLLMLMLVLVLVLLLLLLLGQDRLLLHVLQPQLRQVDLARVLAMVVARSHLAHHVGRRWGRRHLLNHQVA